mmetsp:Transcript_39955/g.118960  ORF Transcript_39955/g.118960 Transcript_39955/m.118960 type:complete len:337 (-) Transcript_39955:288-1298(-)
MHGAGALVPVYGAQLRQAHWQVTVAVVPILVDRHMERAVHGLELVGLVLHLHLVVHVLPIEVVVPARLPQVQLGDVRRVHEVVAALQVQVLPKRFNLVAHERALGVPEHQASARRLLLDREQVQVGTDLAVVAARRLGLEVVVRVELRLGIPGRAVEPLQHGLALVAAPVRARHALQVKAVNGNVAGTLDVRPGAQVPPALGVALLADVVDGNGCLGRARQDAVQDLQLVRLALRLDARARLGSRDLLLDKRHVGAHNLLHLLADLLEVLVRYRLLNVEVVKEPALCPRADGDLCILVDALHRHGHDVRAAVAHAQQLFGFVAGWQLHWLRRRRGC